jgi:hypothetical protein
MADKNVVLAEEVKALVLGIADAQIVDGLSTLDKERSGKFHAFMASRELL